jgi:hypothetical protein
MSKRSRRRKASGNERSRRLSFDPPTTRVRFKLVDAFPPDDRVGHFVIGLAAAMTDLLLLNGLLFPPDNPDRDDFTAAERSVLTRMLLGVIFEVHLFVAKASKVPEVEQFLEELALAYPGDKVFSGTQLVAFLKGDGGATAPRLRNVLRVARNATFHYPEVGQETLAKALRDFGDDKEGEFAYGDRMPSIQAAFAEEVMLNVAYSGLDPRDESTIGPLFSALVQSVVAVIHLAQLGVTLWLSRCPGVSVEPVAGE